MKSNAEIIKELLVITGCDNPNQLASYLAKKYDMKITRQTINQFGSSDSLTITSILLREALEKYQLSILNDL